MLFVCAFLLFFQVWSLVDYAAMYSCTLFLLVDRWSEIACLALNLMVNVPCVSQRNRQHKPWSVSKLGCCYHLVGFIYFMSGYIGTGLGLRVLALKSWPRTAVEKGVSLCLSRPDAYCVSAHATQLLVQALVWSRLTPVACLVFSQPKKACHSTCGWRVHYSPLGLESLEKKCW